MLSPSQLSISWFHVRYSFPTLYYPQVFNYSQLSCLTVLLGVTRGVWWLWQWWLILACLCRRRCFSLHIWVGNCAWHWHSWNCTQASVTQYLLREYLKAKEIALLQEEALVIFYFQGGTQLITVAGGIPEGNESLLQSFYELWIFWGDQLHFKCT